MTFSNDSSTQSCEGEQCDSKRESTKKGMGVASTSTTKDSMAD